MISRLVRFVKEFRVAKNLRNSLDSKIKQHDHLSSSYLKLAIFLSTHGVHPPLTPSGKRLTKRWAEQGTSNSDVAPETYQRIDDSVEKLFIEVLPLLNRDSPILEIGCNSGRSLDYLFRKGFKNLSGVEIGAKAVESFSKTFPDTYKNSRIIVGDVADEILKLKDDTFDLVFTHSVLVNISAKNNFIFREMCRICRGYILILENEGSSRAFPRDFQKMFEKNGFVMVGYRWMVWNQDKSELVFPTVVSDKAVFGNNVIRLFVPKTRT